MEYRKSRSSTILKPVLFGIIGIILGAWISVIYMHQRESMQEGFVSVQQQETQTKFDALVAEIRRGQQDLRNQLNDVSVDQKTILSKPEPKPAQCPPPPPIAPVMCPVPVPAPPAPAPAPAPAPVSAPAPAPAQGYKPAMGKILTQKTFRNEALRLVRVDERKFPGLQQAVTPNAGFWMVQLLPQDTKGAIDDMLTYLVSSEHHVVGAYDKVLQSAPCYPGNPTTRHNRCATAHPIYKNKLNGRKPVVLDVGSNSGFYSLLAGSYGYTAIAFEPQVQCALFVTASTIMSGFEDRITVNNMFIGDTYNAGREVKQRTGCWGTFPYNDPGQNKAPEDLYAHIPEVQTPVSIPTNTLDSQFDYRTTLILLMKVDTEGHEKEVFAGARKLLENKAILNIIVEIGKRQLRMSGISIDESIASLRWVMSLGYKLKVSNYGHYETQAPMDASYLETLFSEGWSSLDALLYLPDDEIY